MFSVVTDSQFELPQFFISQIDSGSIALSLRWVTVKRGAGVGFYLFSKEWCFRVRLTVSVKLNPKLNPKTAFFKKEIDTDPGPAPTPRFTDTPKLMVAIILIYRVILKKKFKNQIEIF